MDDDQHDEPDHGDHRDEPDRGPTGDLAGDLADLMAGWRSRLGRTAAPAHWLTSTGSGSGSAPFPVDGQLAGSVDDPRLSRVELVLTAGRLEAVTLHLTDPVEREQLDRLLGAGEQAWMPGGEQTVRWDRPGHRVVAALGSGRVERIWLGP